VKKRFFLQYIILGLSSWEKKGSCEKVIKEGRKNGEDRLNFHFKGQTARRRDLCPLIARKGIHKEQSRSRFKRQKKREDKGEEPTGWKYWGSPVLTWAGGRNMAWDTHL